jgi:TrmH family RNA methyltransferase
VTDPVVLSGVHAVKHAVRFGARLDRLVSADPTAALTLLASVAPDVAEAIVAGTTAGTAAGPAAGAGKGPGAAGTASGAAGAGPGAAVAGVASGAGIERVSADEVVRLAGGPAELVGLARRPASVPPGEGPAVLLDNPRHLGNVGAVVRVAAGFGARAVLTTGTVDPWHPTVVRAAAGLHFAVPVRRVTDLPERVVAFDPAGVDLRTVRIPADAVLAFGSERHGLSPDVLARATELVAIPLRDRVSSYNLATSVAVALYAWTAAGGR